MTALGAGATLITWPPHERPSWGRGRNTMRERRTRDDPNDPAVFGIRVHGRLGPEWSEVFDGLQIGADDDGDTLLTGVIVDQAALYGLLRTLRDLGLPLVSINRLE
jgi:hypothetical protein